MTTDIRIHDVDIIEIEVNEDLGFGDGSCTRDVHFLNADGDTLLRVTCHSEGEIGCFDVEKEKPINDDLNHALRDIGSFTMRQLVTGE